MNELGKQIYTNEILEYIKDDNFEIVPREKNFNFINKYNLDKIKIKNMLLSLKGEDFINEVEDIDYLEYGIEKLIIYKKEYKLISMFGNQENVLVYIKIKLKDTKLPIISFHLDE